MLLPLVLTFAVSACTGASTFQGTPRDLVLQAARECEVETPGVRVSGTDRYGRVEFSYRTPADHNRFVSCFQQRARERVAGAMASLAAGQPVASADGLRQASIPITVTGNLVRVDVIANGSVPLTLLLDTGASRTVLRPAAATRLGADPLPNAPRWPTTLADGRVIVVPYTRLRSLGLGGLTVEGIDVGVYDLLPGAPNLDGILGGEVLGHFRVTIDRPRERLELELK